MNTAPAKRPAQPKQQVAGASGFVVQLPPPPAEAQAPDLPPPQPAAQPVPPPAPAPPGGDGYAVAEGGTAV
eukprot:3591448-Prymnesium_polylepis.1